MGQRRGEAKRITPGSKPTKVTLYTEDDPKEEALSVGDPGDLNANDGELPLFSSPKLVRSRQVDRGTREIDTSKRKSEKSKGGAGHGVKGDVSADVHLGGHVDSGWPLGNQEVATWSSSFRFELDSGRLQEMLPTANGSFRSTPGGSFRSIPGGSFRFRNGVEEISGTNLPHGSHLKPPRQMENPIHHGSNRFAEVNASIAEVNSRSSESMKVQGGDVVAAPSSDSSVVPVGARKNVAVDVPDSPERSVILQRLRDSKTASPRFGLIDDVSYHKELAKLTIGRDDGLNQWLKPSSPLWKCNSSSPTKTVFTQESTTEVETMPMVRKQSSHSPSPLRESAAPQELASVTLPSSRFKNDRSSGSSLQEQILSISKQSRNVTSPSLDHAHFLPAAIPFQWEDQPGKPKSIRLSRKLSREAVEIVKYMESIPFAKAVEMTGTSADGGIGMGDGDGDQGRTESHRYYGKAQHSREASLGQSSRRYSTNEKLLDLDGSAAAKFLVEQYDTPLSTPGRQSSSPAFSVPFKWEDAPGKAKVGTPARKPNLLQLPPRLAVSSYRSVESFDRVSHPLAGFFAPCVTASSPGSKQALASCKSLPPRAPSPPEQRRKRLGLVGRCSSLPQEGCHITVSRSAASSPTLKQLFHSPSSPTSILTGPDGTSSQTSASNFMFSSGDLDDFTQKTSKSSSYASIEEDFAEGSNSSSSSLPALKPDPHRSRSLGASTPSSSRNLGNPATPTLRGAPSPSASRNSDPATSTWLRASTPSASRNSDPATSTWLRASTPSRNSDPATSTLVGASSASASRNGDPATSTSTLVGASSASVSRNGDPATSISTLLGAPSASASRNGDPATSTSTLLGAPASRNGDPEIQPTLLPVSSEVQASPKRPTRLPYTMPSVAEQMLASFGDSARRQLIQDLSPRLLGQYSGRRLTRSSKTPASQAEQSTIIKPPAAAEGASSPSPAYAAALELLSPAVNLMAQRRKGRSPAKSPLTKPNRRRPRFMLSICRTLKRVILGKPRRRKSIEPKLMVYCDAFAPSTFQFSKSS